MSSRIPSITLNMNNPYSVKTHRECVPIWKKVYPSFKDLEHRPPFELAYACYLNLINHIKKSSPCAYCKKPLEGDGLYFPLEDHHIMPLPCCEKCCTFDIKKSVREMRTMIYVNKYQRSIKYYTWKMMICANLVVPMYNKMIKEEEENRKKEVEQIAYHINTFNETLIIDDLHCNLLDYSSPKKDDSLLPLADQMSGKEVENMNKEEEKENNELTIHNYYLGHINEYDNDKIYQNIFLSEYDFKNENKDKNQNNFMLFISFIATILFSSLYFILNK